MNYFYIYTDLSPKFLAALFEANDIFAKADLGMGVYIVEAPYTYPANIQKLVWGMKPGAYCEVKDAEYDDIEENL